MRRAAGALARCARESAALRSARVVGTSARSDAAAAAAPAASAAATKPPNMQEFKIYRWNPDAPGEKPYLKSYKARRRPASRAAHTPRPPPRGMATQLARREISWHAAVSRRRSGVPRP
jgi:hypothetical protein